MADKFQLFTERARHVLTLAQQEAQQLGQGEIDTGHLLLGLLAQGDSLALRTLAALGAQPAQLRATTLARLADQPHTAADAIGLTSAAKRVIEHAVAAARRLHHNHVGPEHLLLGLALGKDDLAATILGEAGCDAEAIHPYIGPATNTPEATRPNIGWFGYAPHTASQAASPELRELFEQLARLKDQERELRARIDLLAGNPGPPPTPGPTEQPDLSSLTERARQVMALAQDEARRFNHNYIGTEHLLLGLTREGEGIAARVLSSLGVQLPKVRSAVEFIIGRGETMIMGEIGLTPRANKVLALAADEARRLNHHYVGTEHLLLGMIREGEGIAAGVLESLGASLERARAEIIPILSGRDTASPGDMTPPAPQPQPFPPEVIALWQAPRGELRQVIPLVQRQQQGDTTLIAIALERYESSFIVTWWLTMPYPGHATFPRLALHAEDDRGTIYRCAPGGGSGGGSPNQLFEARIEHRCFPALDPQAQSLTLTATVGEQRTTAHEWRFVVALPPPASAP